MVKYLEDKNSGFTPILKLKKEENEPKAQNKTEIITILLFSFFSFLPPYLTQQSYFKRSQITVSPLIEKEVKNTIFVASSFFIEKIDNLLLIVWQKLLPVLNFQIFELFWGFFSQDRLLDQ